MLSSGFFLGALFSVQLKVKERPKKAINFALSLSLPRSLYRALVSDSAPLATLTEHEVRRKSQTQRQ